MVKLNKYKDIVISMLKPVVTASLTLPLRGTREPLLNRVLIIIISNIVNDEVTTEPLLINHRDQWL